VNRDANDDIASSGTLDARTKKISITVSWAVSDATTTSKTLDFYISDIFN
jgi:predicted O-linked N-acetylglucosamine transferase (SPINDLY family)